MPNRGNTGQKREGKREETEKKGGRRERDRQRG
eukprot:COSAG03_NODE_12189_length_557_cov_1.620087_2_plen_32_part_01